MNTREFMTLVASSAVEDWFMIPRPTYLHRFTAIQDEKGNVVRLDADQHLVAFVHRGNIEVSLAYGLVEKGNFVIDADVPMARENARTVLLDCFHQGQHVHREVLLKADRQRCILPMPNTWSEDGRRLPANKVKVARLIHMLAGPPTDFDAYFEQAGLSEVRAAWP